MYQFKILYYLAFVANIKLPHCKNLELFKVLKMVVLQYLKSNI